jgi:hypothetical protein
MDAVTTGKTKSKGKAKWPPRLLVILTAVLSIATLPLMVIRLERHQESKQVSNGASEQGPESSPEKSEQSASKPKATLSAPSVSYLPDSHNTRLSSKHPNPQSALPATLTDKVKQPSKSTLRPPLSASRSTPLNGRNEGVHVIFSTDCSPFQNWQSIVVYYSAEVAWPVQRPV